SARRLAIRESASLLGPTTWTSSGAGRPGVSTWLTVSPGPARKGTPGTALELLVYEARRRREEGHTGELVRERRPQPPDMLPRRGAAIGPELDQQIGVRRVDRGAPAGRQIDRVPVDANVAENEAQLRRRNHASDGALHAAHDELRL